MSLLIDRIGLLVTNDPWSGAGPLGILRNAAVVTEGERIAWVGPATEAPAADERIDADGACVMPGFVDSHTHLVFAGDRASEFAARMRGEPYTGGGIAGTVEATRKADEATLSANVARLMAEARAGGTTTMEIKSGYGLTVEDELRSVNIARTATREVTFLGGHVVPPEYADDPDAYVALVAGPMLDACAPVSRWADVFCERGAFDADAARTILTAAKNKGLGLRVHANQLGPGPGVRLAVELGAASADHCTYLNAKDISALSSSDTVCTLLPAAEFSTKAAYPDARRLLDADVTVALASDCNPGSSYTTSMAFCIAVAVREMGMTCEEAVWASTAGGARALRRSDVGWLTKGAYADLILLAAPSYLHLAYRPGVPITTQVIRRGSPESRRDAE